MSLLTLFGVLGHAGVLRAGRAFASLRSALFLRVCRIVGVRIPAGCLAVCVRDVTELDTTFRPRVDDSVPTGSGGQDGGLCLRGFAERYNGAVFRRLCLMVLMCLGLLAAAHGTAQHAVDAAEGSSHTVSVLADRPSGDGTSERHVAATPAIACPAASVWTSQFHHAVLARALSHTMERAWRSETSARPVSPALRPPVQTPLLI